MICSFPLCFNTVQLCCEKFTKFIKEQKTEFILTTDPKGLKQTVQDCESDHQKPLFGSLSLVVEQGH